MTQIKAPYNFVPVADEVYIPEWSNQISHDIPFSDGISGKIDLTIKAETPIFVRNGHTQINSENQDETYNSFSHIEDRYFIPATTLKGNIRNVLEIMSFGKMMLDKSAMFAQRDLSNKNVYTLINVSEQSHIKCGWLNRSENGFEITDCGTPHRISHKQLDAYIGSNIMESHFSKKMGQGLNKEIVYKGKKYDPKSANFKYKLFEGLSLNNLYFREDGESKSGIFKKLKVDSDGNIKGCIVLTGQPDLWDYPRKPRGGKFYEFVFPEVSNADSHSTYTITDGEFDHFKFIYTNSPEWPMIREKINKKEPVPVFFRTDKSKIKDFGMAFMYKLPYQNSPYELLSNAHKNTEPDLASCIFGYTSQKKSLKGRIQFTHAFAQKPIVCKETVEVTLGTPKASYYPFYISQDGSKGIVNTYKTYNDGKLSGWKRYLNRENVWNYKSESTKLNTKLNPLDKGTEFNCQINFHNLKPEELGAILSALTFHNTPGLCHQIGQGKPYGYGRISIKAHLTNSDQEGKEADYMALFEKAITNKIKNWIISPQLTELFTIAAIPVTAKDQQLYEYLKMDNDSKNNEFKQIKDQKQYLQNYSILQGKNKNSASLYDEYKKHEEAETAQREELKKQQEAEILAKKQELEKLILEQNRTKKIEAGLSFLEEKYDGKEKYKVEDFNGGKKRIEQWLKNRGVSTIPVDQHFYLFNFIARIYTSLKIKEKENWKDINNPKTWSVVKKWIGIESSTEIFYKIIK